MSNTSPFPPSGRRGFLKGSVALAGGYTLTRIFAPAIALADYKEKSIASPAKLQGRLTFDGAAPKPILKDVTSDFNVAGRDPRVWEGLSLGKNKGLKDSIVVVNGVFEGKPMAPKPPVTFAQGAAIHPRVDVFGWTSETKLTVENRDPILHSWQVYLKGEAKDNKAHPAKAPPIEVSLPDAGLYEMRCAPHAWERAFRWAVQNPYFALTDEEGNFEIAGLPEGDYTVDVWSEGLVVRRFWVPVHDDKITLERVFGANDLGKALKGQ